MACSELLIVPSRTISELSTAQTTGLQHVCLKSTLRVSSICQRDLRVRVFTARRVARLVLTPCCSEMKQVFALTVLLHFHGGFLGWIPQIRTVGGIYLHISMIFMILCRHLQTIYDILNICEGMYIYIHMYYNAIYMYIRGSISTACN